MKSKQITFVEAIEQMMLNNGYYASLRKIFTEFETYRPFTGKTPKSTIMALVQRDERFTRIGLGVYALTQYLNQLPKIIPPKTSEEKKEIDHTRIQGMIIELGNLENYNTYTNDKSKIFDNKTLGNIIALQKIPPFTYNGIVRITQFIDVVWFNDRGFPECLFEVENSTNFRNSLVKFAEL